jgi:2-polyprenyl-3-methyl-5-hydroxy-6-metoxy-1,4-benzoquinol methylase
MIVADTFGQEVSAYLQSPGGYEIVERDDGYITAMPVSLYFGGFDDWPEYERRAMAAVRGRVLDIGSGAGRHALYLQEQGHPVLATDVSPLALEVCRQRGIRETRLISVTALTRRLGTFDTLLMMGNNLGLLGGYRRGRWLLRRFGGLTSPEGRIVATTRDPYDTSDPNHLSYHARNRARGRMGGQVRIRLRHGLEKGAWFDYLLLSPQELPGLVEGTGWHVAQVIPSGGSNYAVVLAKDTRAGE